MSEFTITIVYLLIGAGALVLAGLLIRSAMREVLFMDKN